MGNGRPERSTGESYWSFDHAIALPCNDALHRGGSTQAKRSHPDGSTQRAEPQQATQRCLAEEWREACALSRFHHLYARLANFSAKIEQNQIHDHLATSRR
jgi:hypothetical protein